MTPSPPSPFEIGRTISNKLGSTISGPRDRSAIDEILEQAFQTGNPQDVDMAMGQILSRVSPERQAPAMRILENKKNEIMQQLQQQAQNQQRREQLVEQREFDRSKLEEDRLYKQARTEEKREFDQGIKQGKAQEEKQKALQTLDRMKELRSTGDLGFSPLAATGLGRLSSDRVRKTRGEYEQLGKSLISFATNIPIRNRLEFETLAEKLFDASLSDAEAAGILDGMEMIIGGSSRGLDSGQSANKPAKSLSEIWG